MPRAGSTFPERVLIKKTIRGAGSLISKSVGKELEKLCLRTADFQRSVIPLLLIWVISAHLWGIPISLTLAGVRLSSELVGLFLLRWAEISESAGS